MGNSLCRERIARADNSKNPIDRIIGRCAQVSKHQIKKHKTHSQHYMHTYMRNNSMKHT